MSQQSAAPAGASVRRHASAPLHPASRSLNRIDVALVHSRKFTFDGQARLAARVGVSRSTINRMVRGLSRPSLQLAQSVTDALSEDIGVPLQPSDLFSESGGYAIASGCAAFGCSGCQPEHYFDRKGNMRPAFRNKRPGEWSLAPRLSAANVP